MMATGQRSRLVRLEPSITPCRPGWLGNFGHYSARRIFTGSKRDARYAGTRLAVSRAPRVRARSRASPNANVTPSAVATTAVIAAIRKHDPDNLVIVGSPEWDQRIDLVQAEPLQGQVNVMYSVHFYAATHTQWLRDRVQAAVSAGIPVFVTESSGAEASGQGPNNYGEWKAWTAFMDSNKISYLDYSVSDKAGETISVLQPGASAAGGWSDAQLTESGRYWRELLRSHCR